jgi:hypothetical protein
MGLDQIADRLDAALSEADDHLTRRQQEIVESDARKMAHYILRHVLEKAPVGTDPFAVGKALVQGATIGEDESGGELTAPVIAFLESVLEGAKAALTEQSVADSAFDPVDHAVEYHAAHGRWPESASPATITKATAALADQGDDV